ncbi:MAG: hypothetical protein GX649_19685, partial [Chloroflexi bacterium]|nr:hypothetical protein [Chloroflexota bacterium]
MATSRAIRKQDQATRCVDCGAPIRANRVVILNGASFEVPLCEACAAKGVPLDENVEAEVRQRAQERSRIRVLRRYAQREPTRCRMYVLFCEEQDGQPPRDTPPTIIYYEVETLLAGDCAVQVLIPRGVGDLTGTILLTIMAGYLGGHGYPQDLASDPKWAERWPVPWPPLSEEGTGASRPATSRKRKGRGRRRKGGTGGSTLRGRKTTAASGPSARCARCGAPVKAPTAESLAARAGDPLLCEACAEQSLLESVAPGVM